MRALTPRPGAVSNNLVMRLMRIILAAWLAIAMSLSPAAASFTPVKHAAPAAMSMADAMHDCCPDPSGPCPHRMIDCGSMAVCAMKCFGFTAVFVSAPPEPIAISEKISLPPVEHVPSGTSSLLFRPPRA